MGADAGLGRARGGRGDGGAGGSDGEGVGGGVYNLGLVDFDALTGHMRLYELRLRDGVQFPQTGAGFFTFDSALRKSPSRSIRNRIR